MTVGRWNAVLVTSSLSLLSVPLLATDGVIEINQAKALAGGVTSSDTAGFPITIDNPGSYRLTGNLSSAFLGGAGAGIHVIDIVTSHVNLDLNGFVVEGANVSGTGSCISALYNDIHVSNGTVRRCPKHGLNVFQGGIERVTASNNLDAGIKLVSGWIDRSEARANGGRGIDGSIVAVWRSVARNNTGTGIFVDNGLIESSDSQENVGFGFQLNSGVLRGSHSANNTAGQFTGIGNFSANANVFNGCTGLGCTDNAALVQIPPASNSCGNAVCP